MNTQEALKALAPEFLALDEAEALTHAGPWKVKPGGWEWHGRATFRFDTIQGREGVFAQEEACFIFEARRSIRPLLDAHAKALLALNARWLPIESAPKDGLLPKEGTLVDLWSDSQGRVANCFFDKTDNKWVQRIFYYSTGKRLTQFREVADPTHWQPLPKPPVAGDIGNPITTETGIPVSAESRIQDLEEKLGKAREALKLYASERFEIPGHVIGIPFVSPARACLAEIGGE